MSTLVETIQTWLADNESESNLPLEELARMFSAHPGELDGVSCNRAVASRSSYDDPWTLFLPSGQWTGYGFRIQGPVFVLPTEEDPYSSNWSALRERPEFRVTPDSELSVLEMGSEEWCSLPFFFDGVSWEGKAELLFGGDDAEHDWWVCINDVYAWLYAGDLEFAYDDQIEHHFSPGEILEILSERPAIDGEGSALTVYANSAGGISIHHQGVFAIYVGRNPDQGGLGELIEQSAATFKPDGTYTVMSTKLSLEQIAAVLTWIERVDSGLEPNKCIISCTNFDGTLAELRSR